MTTRSTRKNPAPGKYPGRATIRAPLKYKEFPDWAPRDAIDEMNSYRSRGYPLGDRRREVPDMLVRLLTYPDMRRVWDALQSSEKVSPLMSTAHIFAAIAGGAFLGPKFEARLTPAAHRAFIADVQKRSAELAELLRGSDLDWRLTSELDLCRQEAGRHYWRTFSEILDATASGSRFYATPSAGKRTHGNTAYFVRQLTAFFRDYLGRPCRPFVAIATTVAFDKHNPFSAHQVKRLAP